MKMSKYKGEDKKDCFNVTCEKEILYKPYFETKDLRMVNEAIGIRNRESWIGPYYCSPICRDIGPANQRNLIRTRRNNNERREKRT